MTHVVRSQEAAMSSPNHDHISDVKALAAQFRLQAQQARSRNHAHLVEIAATIARICHMPLGNLPHSLEVMVPANETTADGRSANAE
jgi:hypothetical protein